MAVTSAHANTDTSKGFFIADADPATSTGPLTPDTDGDGRKDGEEDANHNGRVDSGETDPNHPDTFCSATPQCGPGQVCQDGVCVDDPGGPGDGDGNGGGCGCSGSGAGASALGLLLLSLIGRIGGRRRRA
jgi:MYXO-CTERM domain-containing protein